MPKSRTLYDVLQVERTADFAAIKTAYRRLARELHPDRTIGDVPDVRARKEKQFKEVSAAYTVLSEPSSRSRYDRGLEESTRSPTGKEHMYGQRFDDFVNRMTEEGVNRDNVGDLLDDFFAMAREFKEGAEMKAVQQRPEEQGSLLGLIEDLFGIETKVKGKRK